MVDNVAPLALVDQHHEVAPETTKFDPIILAQGAEPITECRANQAVEIYNSLRYGEVPPPKVDTREIDAAMRLLKAVIDNPTAENVKKARTSTLQAAEHGVEQFQTLGENIRRQLHSLKTDVSCLDDPDRITGAALTHLGDSDLTMRQNLNQHMTELQSGFNAANGAHSYIDKAKTNFPSDPEGIKAHAEQLVEDLTSLKNGLNTAASASQAGIKANSDYYDYIAHPDHAPPSPQRG
jgi:hypothetical protein